MKIKSESTKQKKIMVEYKQRHEWRTLDLNLEGRMKTCCRSRDKRWSNYYIGSKMQNNLAWWKREKLKHLKKCSFGSLVWLADPWKWKTEWSEHVNQMLDKICGTFNSCLLYFRAISSSSILDSISGELLHTKSCDNILYQWRTTSHKIMWQQIRSVFMFDWFQVQCT
jgi:hypothetical protein